MRWSPLLFRWHRWVGYAVALQVLAWIVGGVLFSWLPFQAWIKGADVLTKPQQTIPSQWIEHLTRLPKDKGALQSVQSLVTAAGPALKLQYASGTYLWSATGGELTRPDADLIARFATVLYKGEGKLSRVSYLNQVPQRLGIVRELGTRGNIWLAEFDDPFKSRFYFDGTSGEFLAVRNEAWVLYDFFWRLHLMDYQGGEDFNNALLRAASIAALLLTLTGLALSTMAVRRHLRKKNVPR